MNARMPHPVLIVPDAMKALLALAEAVKGTGLEGRTAHLVHLRASQINGCSVCVDMHWREARRAGETDERLFAASAWRDAPYFTDAERAALAFTEALTRMSDTPDPVPDDVWNEAARHYGESELAGLVLNIAMINVWNRLNVGTRQVAGEWARAAAESGHR